MKDLAFFISSEAYGGLEMNFLNLAEWLSDEGYRVVIIVDKKAKAIIGQAEKRGLHFKAFNTGTKYLSFGFGGKLAKYLSSEGIGIVVFSFGPDIDQLSWAKTFSPELKIIYMQQMQLGVKKKNPYQTWRNSKIDKWVSPLGWLSQEAKDLTRVDHKKLVEIPLGQDFEQLMEGVKDKAASREKLGLAQDKIFVGSLGRLDPAKGIESIIKALSIIRKSNNDMELVIMGENTRNMPGDHKQVLQELAKTLDISSFVHFLPFSENVQDFFGSIDLFVMASEKETFGMVTIEAMANGIPVIGSNKGGTPELLDFGAAGILFEQGDHTDLAKKIIEYLNDPGSKGDLTAKGKDRAISRYSRKVVVGKYRKLIEGL